MGYTLGAIGAFGLLTMLFVALFLVMLECIRDKDLRPEARFILSLVFIFVMFGCISGMEYFWHIIIT